jgi:predicted transcriptional regulator
MNKLISKRGRGRPRKGEEPVYNLTDIISRQRAGATLREIADVYGVTREAVRRVAKGRVKRTLPPEHHLLSELQSVKDQVELCNLASPGSLKTILTRVIDLIEASYQERKKRAC